MLRVSSLIREDREFEHSTLAIKEARQRGAHEPVVINGLSGGASDAYLVECILDLISSDTVPTVILPNDDECVRVLSLLDSSDIPAVIFKPRDLVLNNISASHDTQRERLSVLHSLASGGKEVIITTPAAALLYTMPCERLLDHALSIKVGDELSPEGLTERLVAMGFSRSDTVEGRGAVSHRGGIVDFYPEGDLPVRCEFFGDEIDRLVYFDPITQRSVNLCESVTLLPVKEIAVDDKTRARMLREVDICLKNPDISEEIRSKLMHERASITSGALVPASDKYMGVIYDRCECLFDYLGLAGRDTFLVLGTSACRECAEDFLKSVEERAAGLLSYGAATAKMAKYSSPSYERILADGFSVHLNSFAGGVGNAALSGLFGFRSRRCVSYGDNPRMLIEDVSALCRSGYRIVLLTEHKDGIKPISEALDEAGISYAVISDGVKCDFSQVPSGTVVITVGDFSGFDLIVPKIAVLSMARDKGRAVMANKRRQRVMKRLGSATKRLMSHADLSVGDYVVHANYGIGLFEGVEAVTVDGVTRDYITIRYAGTDKLFVPCDRLEMIGKYIGDRERDGTVKLSKMGGTEWARTKARAKSAARDIAKSLIELYAERQRRPGFAFPPSCDMEEEFDSKFEYEETPSQLVAIEEIKRDMMRPVPMNRLLCGDVGFGKTEVAVRAAFKAILAGKQVALLVPTTILALQHYGTIVSRMRGYAVNIEMLSRFKKPKEREKIIKKTKRGEVDLLIGTHALLSKEIEFRDLGLLIIDEEQRFGVVQKEKLRKMAKNVDTLMLSATPIPRTLNMSMSGINDISILDEAPGERRPVDTYVLEHDDALIFDALTRELARGGQVLYIYNKIEDIDLVAGRIQDALPEARVAYAHGKMERDELEDIWQMLTSGEIDILVCTTIIETGVDLPNANTLVIENADKFGLSQLHQIRGRVGRSERQAYAYFTFRRGKALSPVAEKRLEAIREFVEFGAGFKIALRDLEIRGAGNLLGAEQHGYIESVGYDLYMKLLNEAVLEERGETNKKQCESTIVINLSAHIPEKYIPSSDARMEMYKRISALECQADADDIYDELQDRFGDVPRVTKRLIDVSLCRALAERAGIRKVEFKDNRITFVSGAPRLDVWSDVFSEFPSLSFLGVGSPLIVYRMHKGEEPTEIAALVLSKYVSSMENTDAE